MFARTVTGDLYLFIAFLGALSQAFGFLSGYYGVGRIDHGGIASRISCWSSLGKCFWASEKIVVDLLTWRCLYKSAKQLKASGSGPGNEPPH